MKYKFVLDENVFRHALNRVDKHDNPDDSAMNLIKQIAKNCHRIILDKKLNSVFIRVLERLKDAREKSKSWETKIDDKFIIALIKIKVTGQKYLFQAYPAEDLENFSGIESIPHKDRYMAKLAINENANYIVTSDEAFENSVNNNDFLADKNISAIKVKDALERAGEN